MRSLVGRFNVLSFVDINSRHFLGDDISMTACFCRVVRPFLCRMRLTLHFVAFNFSYDTDTIVIFFCKSVQDLTEKRY